MHELCHFLFTINEGYENLLWTSLYACTNYLACQKMRMYFTYTLWSSSFRGVFCVNHEKCLWLNSTNVCLFFFSFAKVKAVLLPCMSEWVGDKPLSWREFISVHLVDSKLFFSDGFCVLLAERLWVQLSSLCWLPVHMRMFWHLGIRMHPNQPQVSCHTKTTESTILLVIPKMSTKLHMV